jgi:adenine deaminase
MCDRSCHDTAGRLEAIERVARELGAQLPHPFGVVSFLALSAIPRLRVTDQGVVDVEARQIVPLQTD